MRFSFVKSVAVMAALALLAPAGARAQQSVETFYKGRTVSIYIGFSAGGSYDFFGRLLSRHLGKHIPGNPVVVAQAMPGAGSLTLSNWMFRIAPKDGTTLGIVSQTVALDEALKSPGIQYKAAQFNWIGRATSNVEISPVWHTAKAKTIEEAKKVEDTMASTGAGSPSESYLKLMNGVIGTKFKLVGPYPGSTDGLLAMERGETDGAFTSWNSLKSQKKSWIDEKKVSILVQYAQQRVAEMGDVPTMVELGRTPEEKQIFAFAVSGGEVGRSFMAPPSVPADRVAALRKAFDETVADPELLAEVKQANLDFFPASGEALQKIINDTASVSPEVVARMQTLLAQ